MTKPQMTDRLAKALAEWDDATGEPRENWREEDALRNAYRESLEAATEPATQPPDTPEPEGG